MQSLIRWAGGKRWISKEIVNCINNNISVDGTYYELFAGGLSVFFELKHDKCVVSDTIKPLITMYKCIQSNMDGLRDELRTIQTKNITSEIYISYRNELNSGKCNDVRTAALFIFLNKAGYNGVWRQNKAGDMNIPIGSHSKITLPSTYDLMMACDRLQYTDIRHVVQPYDVFDIIAESKRGDFIFADPPYYKTFNNYDGIALDNPEEFHQLLAIELWKAYLRGVCVITTNSDTEETRKWYGAFCSLHTFERQQRIANTNEGRNKWNELLAIAK